MKTFKKVFYWFLLIVSILMAAHIFWWLLALLLALPHGKMSGDILVLTPLWWVPVEFVLLYLIYRFFKAPLKSLMEGLTAKLF